MQSVGLAKVCDGECQTPVHFVEKHIDPKYDWNEWSLRRKAIQVRAYIHVELAYTACHTQHMKHVTYKRHDTHMYAIKLHPDTCIPYIYNRIFHEPSKASGSNAPLFCCSCSWRTSTPRRPTPPRLSCRTSAVKAKRKYTCPNRESLRRQWSAAPSPRSTCSTSRVCAAILTSAWRSSK